MFWMLRQWSRFVIWVNGGFKGAADLKDAWFVGCPTYYSGVIVGAGTLPVSSKGWMLGSILCAYLAAVFFAFQDLGLPLVLYVLLGLLGMVVVGRIALPKTYWTTHEKLKEIWGK
jgi:hypothetical protein